MIWVEFYCFTIEINCFRKLLFFSGFPSIRMKDISLPNSIFLLSFRRLREINLWYWTLFIDSMRTKRRFWETTEGRLFLNEKLGVSLSESFSLSIGVDDSASINFQRLEFILIRSHDIILIDILFIIFSSGLILSGFFKLRFLRI